MKNYAALSAPNAAALRDEALGNLNALKEQTELAKKLEWERDTLWGKLIEAQLKQEVNLQRYQEHMFFVSQTRKEKERERKGQSSRDWRLSELSFLYLSIFFSLCLCV